VNSCQFYEHYWVNPEAEPEYGQLVEERKALLKSSLAGLHPGARVLDAGCGIGVFTNFLKSEGFDTVGVDISETAIGHAKRRYPKGHFEVAAIEDGLPFKNEEFVAVWCTEVLEHLFDVHAALVEMNRVLQTGGTLVLTMPYHSLIKNLIVALLAFERHYDPCGPHIRFFTRRSLADCLQQAGFVVERWAGVGRFWPVWMSHFIVARKNSAFCARRDMPNTPMITA
jgi:ubiquinone/menaquinone biosynthesis C-methylase UbiE